MNQAFRDEAGTTDHSKTWASNPPFDLRHLRAIELALRAAWEALRKNPKHARELSTENEVHISHLLRQELNRLREMKKSPVKGYNCDTFERPHLGAEMKTLEGKIRKPDIVFGLCGRPRRGVSDGITDSIFVECKILEQGKRNVAAYCRDGMHRFVEGSYAPWMREGMMLAYARTSQALPGDLQPTLDDPAMKVLLAVEGKLDLCKLSRVEPRVYISIHARSWEYPEEDGGGEPGPIELRHLWLQV